MADREDWFTAWLERARADKLHVQRVFRTTYRKPGHSRDTVLERYVIAGHPMMRTASHRGSTEEVWLPSHLGKRGVDVGPRQLDLYVGRQRERPEDIAGEPMTFTELRASATFVKAFGAPAVRLGATERLERMTGWLAMAEAALKDRGARLDYIDGDVWAVYPR